MRDQEDEWEELVDHSIHSSTEDRIVMLGALHRGVHVPSRWSNLKSAVEKYLVGALGLKEVFDCIVRETKMSEEEVTASFETIFDEPRYRVLDEYTYLMGETIQRHLFQQNQEAMFNRTHGFSLQDHSFQNIMVKSSITERDTLELFVGTISCKFLQNTYNQDAGVPLTKMVKHAFEWFFCMRK